MIGNALRRVDFLAKRVKIYLVDCRLEIFNRGSFENGPKAHESGFSVLPFWAFKV
jgi:hypothetical protein